MPGRIEGTARPHSEVRDFSHTAASLLRFHSPPPPVPVPNLHLHCRQIPKVGVSRLGYLRALADYFPREDVRQRSIRPVPQTRFHSLICPIFSANDASLDSRIRLAFFTICHPSRKITMTKLKHLHISACLTGKREYLTVAQQPFHFVQFRPLQLAQIKALHAGRRNAARRQQFTTLLPCLWYQLWVKAMCRVRTLLDLAIWRQNALEVWGQEILVSVVLASYFTCRVVESTQPRVVSN